MSDIAEQDVKTERDDKDIETFVDQMLTRLTPTSLRLLRAVIVWPLSSALIYAGPISQPRYVIYGLVIGVMSLMNVTKYLAGLAVFLLLALAVAPSLWRLV